MMSQKKTLQEQISRLSQGRADWLEPLQNWILTARNAGEIAVSGSLQEKRVLAKEVFGSNLVLDRKKARGYCLKPWSLLVENSSSRMVERAKGIEPSCEAWKASVLPLNYARLRCGESYPPHGHCQFAIVLVVLLVLVIEIEDEEDCCSALALSIPRVYRRRAWQRCFSPAGASWTRPTVSTRKRTF
jgi:hypothetical protein